MTKQTLSADPINRAPKAPLVEQHTPIEVLLQAHATAPQALTLTVTLPPGAKLAILHPAQTDPIEVLLQSQAAEAQAVTLPVTLPPEARLAILHPAQAGAIAELAQRITSMPSPWWRPGFQQDIRRGGSRVIVHRNLEALLLDAWQAHCYGDSVVVLTHSKAVADDCRERLQRRHEWAPNLMQAVDEVAGRHWGAVYIATSDFDAAMAATPAKTIALRRKLWLKAVNSALVGLHVVAD